MRAGCRVAAGLLALAAAQLAGGAAADVCSTLLCREPRTLEIALRDGKKLELAVPREPIVQDERVASLFVGESITLRVAFDERGIAKLTALEQAGESDAIVTMTLTQQPLSGTPSTQLVIRSTLTRPLKMQLGMSLAGGEGVFKTSSCPVLPGAAGFEMWHDPIVRIYATELRLLDEDAEMACE